MIYRLVKNLLLKISGYKINIGSVLYNVEISRKNWLGSKVCLTNVTLGKYTYVGNNTRLRDCKVGAFCSIGRDVKIGLGYHPIKYISTSPFMYRRKFLGINGFANKDRFKNADYRNTVIGNDVWIGDNVIICGGVVIGDGSVIGAGSIVTKNVDPYGVYVGVPAKKIKQRVIENNTYGIPDDWWNLTDIEISKLINRSYE